MCRIGFIFLSTAMSSFLFHLVIQKVKIKNQQLSINSSLLFYILFTFITMTYYYDF